MRNLLGLDVGTLDVPAFLAGARHLYPVLVLLWAALVVQTRRPRLALLGALAANAYVWATTNFPLARLYAMGASHDRVSNVGLCQVVAAGNSPLRTWQVGQLHFEPFWGLLVATLSGFNPERVLVLYPWFALLTAGGFATALYVCLRPLPGSRGLDPWERAFAAAFATLLCASPLDHAATYRNPWALTFLLKPNHALGLVLFPFVLRAAVAAQTFRQRLGAGLLLHLLGWIFILYMVYVSAGLALFAVLSLLFRRPEAKRDLAGMGVILGVNLLVVSPYLVMLLVGYPFLDKNPQMVLAPFSAHPLETTLRLGPLFWLGLWGAVLIHRRAERLGRAWSALLLAGYLIWLAYPVLSWMQLARERDEIDYWLRFLMAASAGVGAWDLLGRAARRFRGAALAPQWQAAALMVLALPWTLPAWWDPQAMDPYFVLSRPPLPETVRSATDFLRTSTERQAVLAGDTEFAAYGAALGARRSLLGSSLHMPRDYARRLALQEQLLAGTDPQATSQALAAYGVRYLVVTRHLLAQHPGLLLDQLRRREDLAQVHLAGDPERDFVAVFRLTRASS